MKLDPRIKSLSDILTCFDTERAKAFIGENGFFANKINFFTPGEPYCRYGTLTNVFDDDDQVNPYLKGHSAQYPFFLPESSLKLEENKPIEKKYRSYTLNEFCDKFPIGRPINLRMRGGDEIGNFLLIGYWQKQSKDQEDAYIYIGRGSYDLEELFENYEWHDGATGAWAPFGVEVEE